MEVTPHNILELTPVVMAVLDRWRLNDSAICRLLGIDADTRSRELRKFRQNLKGLPFSDETAARIGHICGIDEALRTAFPHSDQMSALWLRQPHRRFDRQKPIQVMLDEGVDGLMQVHVEVDCAYGWTLTETETGGATGA
jgi:uncharacterized protein (DUF2384 family)